VNTLNPPSFTNPYAGVPGGTPSPRTHVTTGQFGSYNFTLPVVGDVLNPVAKPGYIQNWNFVLEHQLRNDMSVSLAYVGNHSLGSMGSHQLDPAILAPGATVANENSRRLYLGLGTVQIASPYVYDIYHSLQDF
jgi:hypothetical protein